MKELSGEDFNHEVRVARDAMEAEKSRQASAEARKLAKIGVSVNRTIPGGGPTGNYNDAVNDWVKDAIKTPEKTYTMEWRSEKSEATDPSHYNQMAIQPSTYIIENDLSWCEGNIVKYVSRWQKKNGLEDLLKAQVYLGWLIDQAKAE